MTIITYSTHKKKVKKQYTYNEAIIDTFFPKYANIKLSRHIQTILILGDQRKLIIITIMIINKIRYVGSSIRPIRGDPRI